jgi:hypothetical protein
LSVGITVSTRNLDVYLNGNLVKSCFLSGVPKPVSGSVTLNADGGFSGWMCGFYHYDKMLVPSDAQAFYGSGVPCSVPGTSINNGLRHTNSNNGSCFSCMLLLFTDIYI